MIKEISFHEIKIIWEQGLWPNIEIKPVSSMTYTKQNDMQVYNLDYSKPVYYAYYEQDKIIGVNSGHLVNNTEYRSRGVWVNPEVRGKKIGKTLLMHTIEQGKKENCKIIWSFPRKNSLWLYESVGFKKSSDWIDEGVLFGPNCYVYIDL